MEDKNITLPFLQTSAWESFQKTLGKKTIRREGEGWEYLAMVEKAAFIKRLYLPYGPVATSEEAFKEALASLRAEAKILHVDLVRVEPVAPIDQTLLTGLGFKKIRHVQPEQSWILTLGGSDDELISQMKQNNRNIFRNYAKKGITITKSTKVEDVKNLTNLLEKTASKNDFRAQQSSYLRSQAEALFKEKSAILYQAVYENKVIAAALFFVSNDGYYYAHAATDYDYSKLSAGTALVAQAIIDANNSGRKRFDFAGIAPVDADKSHPWFGFSKFKRSFGGEEKKYLGTWDLPINPLKYRLYRILFKLLRR